MNLSYLVELPPKQVDDDKDVFYTAREVTRFLKHETAEQQTTLLEYPYEGGTYRLILTGCETIGHIRPHFRWENQNQKQVGDLFDIVLVDVVAEIATLIEDLDVIAEFDMTAEWATRVMIGQLQRK